jgi:hypothetical protein
VLPGALYVWGHERYVGKWELGSPDRLLRFVAASAVFHVFAAPATYFVWRRYVQGGKWHEDDALAWGLWACLLVYLVVPYAIGTAVGARTTGERWTIRLLQVPDPPTAWDYFFSEQPDGWIRLRLKSGDWIGGAFAQGAFAAGYPDPSDIFFTAAEIDADTGEFGRAVDGSVVLREEKLLVAWEDVEYLEFIDG